jgi:hypothetical protein
VNGVGSIWSSQVGITDNKELTVIKAMVFLASFMKVGLCLQNWSPLSKKDRQRNVGHLVAFRFRRDELSVNPERSLNRKREPCRLL